MCAGKADAEIQRLINSKKTHELMKENRILTRLFFHDDDEEYLVFKASDFIWLGYRKGFYGSSGVLYKGLSAGLPSIASAHGLIGMIVNKYYLGTVVDTESKNAISKAIRDFTQPIRKNKSWDAEKAAEYSARHNSSKHVEGVYRTLLSGTFNEQDS